MRSQGLKPCAPGNFELTKQWKKISRMGLNAFVSAAKHILPRKQLFRSFNFRINYFTKLIFANEGGNRKSWWMLTVGLVHLKMHRNHEWQCANYRTRLRLKTAENSFILRTHFFGLNMPACIAWQRRTRDKLYDLKNAHLHLPKNSQPQPFWLMLKKIQYKPIWTRICKPSQDNNVLGNYSRDIVIARE